MRAKEPYKGKTYEEAMMAQRVQDLGHELLEGAEEWLLLLEDQEAMREFQHYRRMNEATGNPGVLPKPRTERRWNQL